METFKMPFMKNGKTRAQKMAEYRKAWKERNKEKVLAQAKEFRELNREQINAYNREWHAKNPYRVKYLNAHRKGRVAEATPPWADKAAIRKFYIECPEGHHVDHIVPLHGEAVSGLHTLENLQYLPAHENLKKGNTCLL